MAAVRLRFTPAERKVFTPGTDIEYLHGNRWYPGTILGPIKRFSDDQQYLEVRRNHTKTRTMLDGPVDAFPKHLRLPEGKRTGKYI